MEEMRLKNHFVHVIPLLENACWFPMAPEQRLGLLESRVCLQLGARSISLPSLL